MTPEDGARQKADALIAALASLELGPMADRVAANALQSLAAPQAVQVLEEIAARASLSPAADRALTAMSRALQLGDDRALSLKSRAALRQAACDLRLPLAAGLLAETPEAERTPCEFVPPHDPEIGALSLGHQKALARRADPERMARLAAQGDVRVIRELLLNPRLTEALVVRVAARRPVRPEVLIEIFASPRWGVRMAVRRAIALNPCAPVELAARLLPHLASEDLCAIAKDGQLKPSLCATARHIIRQREHSRAPEADQPPPHESESPQSRA